MAYLCLNVFIGIALCFKNFNLIKSKPTKMRMLYKMSQISSSSRPTDCPSLFPAVSASESSSQSNHDCLYFLWLIWVREGRGR